MKKIRIINNRKVTFIERSDIETLIISKDFVKKELFTEPSIVNMECDIDGYYCIENHDNVEYIASLGYIPDYDTFSKLSPQEINSLADFALSNKTKLTEIIKKICMYKEKLTNSEKRTLKKASFLDYKCANSIENNAQNASLEGSLFRSMEEALLAQLRNYTYSIVKMAENSPVPSNNYLKKPKKC